MGEGFYWEELWKCLRLLEKKSYLFFWFFFLIWRRDKNSTKSLEPQIQWKYAEREKLNLEYYYIYVYYLFQTAYFIVTVKKYLLLQGIYN